MDILDQIETAQIKKGVRPAICDSHAWPAMILYLLLAIRSTQSDAQLATEPTPRLKPRRSTADSPSDK